MKKVLHLKLVNGMRGILLAYVVWNHIKVAHILPGYDAYLNLDNEVIAKAPADKRLNFRFSHDCLDRVYFDYKCDTFKISNALV